MEALRAEKHRVINALEKQKLNPMYSHVRKDIAAAQSKLQQMSIETKGSDVKSIVEEAQRRRLVEPYADIEQTTAVDVGAWVWWLLVLLVVVVVYAKFM